MMYIDVKLNESRYKHSAFEECLLRAGEDVGTRRYGKKWKHMTNSREDVYRIIRPPVVNNEVLSLYLQPYKWEYLQKRRMVQPAQMDEKNDLSYIINALALTANALVMSLDERIVMHYKRGGYINNSIHTFGGYVNKSDLDNGGIEETIKRELSESEELGLDESKMHVIGLFGRENNMPSILWGFGTAAIYGMVHVDYLARELEDMVDDNYMNETKGLYVIEPNQLSMLASNPRLHPQTKQVIPKLEVILYEN